MNEEELYELLRNIKDPEKPYTLEELNIIDEDSIHIIKYKDLFVIRVLLCPTIPNCSLILDIGLCIRYVILKEYGRVKLDINVKEGTHLIEKDVNKQLNDKERYCAALENNYIVDYIKNLIKN